MKNTFRSLLLVSSVLLLTSGFASAQGIVSEQYFRQIGMPDQLAVVTPPAPEDEEKYNFAVGPVRFDVAVGIGMEWNDNIELSEHNKQSDFILRPSVTLDGYWPITELNTLRFSLGISYAKYLDHSEFDTNGVLLSPSSALAFTIHAGNFVITLRDQFSYQEDPLQNPVISGTGNYQRFENTAGIQIDWPASDTVKLTFGYNHYNLITFQKEFEQEDRATETVYIRPSYVVSPSFTVGLNTSANWVNFDKNIQNDGVSYMVGPFIDYTISEATKLYAEAGYQLFDFDTNGTIRDTSNSSSWYAKIQLTNQISEALSHRLIASKTSEVGFGSNFYELYHAEYSATWRITPNLSLDPSLFGEYYKTSANSTTLSEKAWRFGAAIGARYALTPSLTLGADYRFVMKDSDAPESDYTQNVFMLNLYYNF